MPMPSIWNVFGASQEKSHNKEPRGLELSQYTLKCVSALQIISHISLPFSFSSFPPTIIGIKPGFLNMPHKYSTSPPFAFHFQKWSKMFRLTLNSLYVAPAGPELVPSASDSWVSGIMGPCHQDWLRFSVLADLKCLCQEVHWAFTQHWL